MTKFQESVLPNGLRVLTEKQSGTKALSLCIGVHVGSINETASNNGISHLIEHLVFKATKNRSAYEISAEIENLGGDINAYTSRELTCFHTYTLGSDYQKSIEILSDIILNPKLDAEDIKNEKKVILHEIAMTEDNYEEQIFDDFFTLWYPKQKTGLPILGSKKNLKAITKRQITSYRKRHYRPENTLIVASGDLEHKKILTEVKKYFSSNNKPLRSHKTNKPDKEKRFIKLKEKASEQCHMLFGFPASSYKDGIFYEAAAINTYLGGGGTSLLYQNLRENDPLCYSVYSMFAPMENVGSFLIYIGTSNKNAYKTSDKIIRYLKQIKKNGIDKKQLDIIKKQWLRSVYLQYEDLESRMNQILQDAVLERKYRDLNSIVKGIKTITRHSVMDYIENHFHIEDISLLVFSDMSNSNFANIKALIK